MNLLCQVKHHEPSVCLQWSLFVPTNRFYSHEMAVFGWFDLETYQLIIGFPLAIHARPQAVETVENCCRESFMQIPETPKRCMHNWFLALPGLQILFQQTLEKVMSQRWVSGGLRVWGFTFFNPKPQTTTQLLWDVCNVITVQERLGHVDMLINWGTAGEERIEPPGMLGWPTNTKAKPPSKSSRAFSSLPDPRGVILV